MLSKYLILGSMLAALAGYGAHVFITNRLENEIEAQREIAEQYVAQNAALQSAATINEQTILSLESRIEESNVLIGELQRENNDISKERDEYLTIFRQHDLTNLARARPGLIENRINDGTREVFQDLREDMDNFKSRVNSLDEY